MSNAGLAITALVAVVYGVSFAVTPKQVQAQPAWRWWTVGGALVCLVLFIVFLVIPWLTG